MPVYIYKVRDKSGRIMQGQMDAANDRELRKKLDERGYFIIEYADKSAKKDILSIEILPSFNSVKMIDISVFSWQLFTMLDAGLPLVRSLKTIVNQTNNPRFKAVISDTCRRVEEGSSFSDALKQHPKVFSKLFVQMVNAGEVGGVLDEMLKRLAQYYERQAEIKSKMTSAMIYPTLLLTVSAVVIVFLITVVLPQFATIFRDIGARVPPPTQFLLSLSVIIKSYWQVVILILAGIFFFLRLYTLTEKGRYDLDLFIIQLPVIGGLVKKSITARFTQTLSTLVSGGIPILTALDVVTDTIGNMVVAKVLRHVAARVEEGKPIAQPLEESKLFPDMVVNMIKVGEDTGALEKMLDKISDFYDKEVNAAIEGFTKLIEPLMMVVMAVIIGFIAISIFLPLADLMTSLRGS
jgi:type IV pilus assembly protein PilC